MAEFCTTKRIAYHLEDIIIEAKKKLVLVSPYLKLSEAFLERLIDADSNNIDIKIVYGKDELKSAERNKLSKLKNLELYFCKNLHAKCYLNEFEMVITSMNFYDYSEMNNREMGIYLTRKDDTELFMRTAKEVKSILNSSSLKTLKSTAKKSSTQKTQKFTLKKKFNEGHCIRCLISIPFNEYQPLCPGCYDIWSYFENENYREDYCHRCGKQRETTKKRPFCYDCEVKLGKHQDKAPSGW
ncbi:phospholipase D family protein [Halocola ammonii]